MDKKNNFKRQKIFFVYPPKATSNSKNDCAHLIENMVCDAYLLPLDMMMLSSVAKKRGYETKFCDYSLKNETVYDFLRDLRVFKPDFLVLNINNETFEHDLSILTQAKDMLDDIVVIAKGEVFNFNSYAIMQKYPEIDIALKGEIEESFDEIIQYNNLKTIKGITYQINNKITSTPDRKIEKNIDYLPNLDRELINNNSYIRFDTKKPQSAIMISKGHPFKHFSPFELPLEENIVRYRKIELVIDEIRKCTQMYNIKNFIFQTDVFNYDNNYVQNLCREILINNLKINFFANIKIENIDIKTLNLMKKAGCTLVNVKIESESEKIFNENNGVFSKEKIKEAIKMLNTTKIQVFAKYLTGLATETKETLFETYKFAKELNTQYAFFYTPSVLKGSKYYDYIIKNRLGKINHTNPYVFLNTKSYTLSAQQIREFTRKMNKAYYLRPDYILKMTMEIDSVAKLKSYYGAFIDFAKNKKFNAAR